jgi:hypothetical protein
LFCLVMGFGSHLCVFARKTYENGQYAESMKNFKQSLSAVVEVKRKRPKSGGEKTTMVIGYRLISDFLRG